MLILEKHDLRDPGRPSMPTANSATATPAQRGSVLWTEPGSEIGQRHP